MRRTTSEQRREQARRGGLAKAVRYRVRGLVVTVVSGSALWGVNEHTIRRRLGEGMSCEEAFTRPARTYLRKRGPGS